MDAILMMPEFILHPATISIVCFGLGIGLTLILTQIIAKARSKTFEQNIKRQIEGAKKEAENIVKSAQLDAAAENMKKKEQFAAEVNKTRAELHETELRFNKREDTLDRQAQTLQQQEREFRKQGKEVMIEVAKEAKRERRIGELWSEALRVFESKEYDKHIVNRGKDFQRSLSPSAQKGGVPFS